MAKKSQDHVGHMKASNDKQPLRGEISRKINVTFLGAGSGFAPKVLNDIMMIDKNKGGTISLVDIDAKRLTIMKNYIANLITKYNYKNWNVIASTNRKQVLKNTDYVINCIEVSGVACVKHDNEIPLSYGIDQCIGDTIGPGGLFKALRTVPEWLNILRDIQDICPKAIVLNYTNPMSIMCLGAGRVTPGVQVVGLCHSVQGSSAGLAKRAGVDIKEVEWDCAGINHLAWFTKFKHNGKDLYPLLMKNAEKDLAGKFVKEEDKYDLVRKDMMLHFGAYITESSGHLSEYLPYYRKRKDLMKKYMGPNYNGESGFYSKNWPTWRKDRDQLLQDYVKGTKSFDCARTWEYASWIIEAREKDAPFRIHGNVMNKKNDAGPLISNLSHDGVVEVACMIDRNGINPTVYGKLPPQMAAICQSNMNMYDLAATSAINKDIGAAIHSLMLDPLTAAICSPKEIKEMTLKMFKAEKEYLKGFK